MGAERCARVVRTQYRALGRVSDERLGYDDDWFVASWSRCASSAITSDEIVHDDEIRELGGIVRKETACGAKPKSERR
jgi:hypothetical protein